MLKKEKKGESENLKKYEAMTVLPYSLSLDLRMHKLSLVNVEYARKSYR